jgi:competence protein ComEC
VVIDAGRAWKGGDAGRSTVIPYLRRRGGDVVLFILTHPHADHAGGAASLLRALRPPSYRDAAFVAPAGPYRESLEAARREGIEWRRVRPGEIMRIDGVELEFLAPDSAWTVSLDDPNEASTVVRASFGAVRFLLVGDAEAGEEQWLLENASDLRADVLKVGHHGSRTSSTPAFIAAVEPRLALISVGAGNRYGHPDATVMAALSDRGATVLRTDQLGSIVVSTDGRTLTIEADGETWPFSQSSSRE